MTKNRALDHLNIKSSGSGTGISTGNATIKTHQNVATSEVRESQERVVSLKLSEESILRRE